MNNTNNKRLLLLLVLALFPIVIVYIFMLRGSLPFPQSLDLGLVEIQVYSLFILAGIGVTAFLFDKNKQSHQQLKKIDTLDALIWILIPAIIGARIWHILTDFYLYSDNLIEIFYIWNGGLGIFGGMLGGLIGVYLYTKKIAVDLWDALALLVVFLPLGQVIGRFGNFANHELYGPKTNLPWGLYLREKGESFHPSFAYEQFGNILLFMVMYYSYKRYGLSKNSLFVYLMGYGTVRFFVDFFRTEPHIWGVLTLAQIVSLLLVLFAGFYFAKLMKRSI